MRTRGFLTSDVHFDGDESVPAGTEVEVTGRVADTLRIEHDGRTFHVARDKVEGEMDRFLRGHFENAPPPEIRDYWPWLFARGGAIHKYEMRDYRLSSRETRLTDDEVREDCAVFAVIGRDKIDAIEEFIRERYGKDDV